ncbi:NIMA-interacting protein tinc [Diaporthe sp. PMI_573]|nr:NIMA-interacting protein tinc [Diaporthaceae sp. PMI_573]
MSSSLKMTPLLMGVVVLFLFAGHVHAFGAGNIASISKVEGQNWRHGDIEDALLKIMMARAVGGKKFDKLSVSRTYFGNWLRDYSQAIDVGTVKSVSAEAIRLLLCVLGFLTFGYGSREFEVTADRLGCYRPEDHIDNPKNYADNEDARQYDRRLRGPIDESVELAVDEETGMKNYIANENVNIMTSALHVRRLFTKCVELGRRYQRDNRKEDLHEALRLMGTGLHCLEDYLAHSNYCELALIELGERDVFPHVGRNTQIRLPGARHEVYPIVTGTFGGVDFLHSVTGEVSDKLTQNEIDELEGTLQQSQNTDTSMLRNLLDKIPDGLFGSDDKKSKMDDIQQNASAAQVEQMSVSPRDPEEYTLYVQNIFRQVMPAIEFHDEILQSITEAIEKIPILPQIVEQLEEQLSVFVFSVIAPFVVPVINQVKNELKTGSDEVIQSSENEQHIVFNDDDSTDPTHSMLSKDHFSNILNEIAGKTASRVVAWTVPQLMEAIDDEGADIDRVCSRIISGVLHHPAQRDQGHGGAREGREMMFRSVEEWWNEMPENAKDEYRNKLSRSGVKNGENHKEGVHDTGHGHGCSGKLSMHKQFGKGGDQSVEDRIASAAAGAIIGGVTSSISGMVSNQTGGRVNLPDSNEPNKGGGLLGNVSSLLEGALDNNSSSFESRRRDDDGGYTQSVSQYGRSDDGRRYEQAEYSRTRYDDGREREEYRRTEQREDGRGREHGYGYQETQESYGGRQHHEERRWEGETSSYRREETESYGSSRREESGGYGGGYGRQESGGYGGGGGYGSSGREESYGGGGGGGGGYDSGRRDEYGSGRQEGGYGGDNSSGRRRDDDDNNDLVGNLVEGAAKHFFGGDKDRREGGSGGGGWFS